MYFQFHFTHMVVITVKDVADFAFTCDLSDNVGDVTDKIRDLLNVRPSEGQLLLGEACQLWWCGKALPRDVDIASVAGKSEKTKLNCTITSSGGGSLAAPTAVDLQKEQLQEFTKQKEAQRKALPVECEDATAWADPKSLRKPNVYAHLV